MLGVMYEGEIMESPDIGVAYNEHLPSELFIEFKDSLNNNNLNILVESQPDNGPYACPEWFMLTAGAVYIAKSYFDGFLKEVGKDHYKKLKNNLSCLTNNVMSRPKIEPVLIGTKGKVSLNNPYSLAFSIYAEANDGNRFKLLLPKPSSDNEYSKIICAFLEFLNDFHSGIKVLEDTGFNMQTRPPSGMIFVHMNPETKQIEWLNHLDYQ